MPIFEYVCEKCEIEFEDLIYADVAPACPKCGKNEVRKLVSRPAKFFDDQNGKAYSSPSNSTGCSGCSGGNCANCGR